MSKREVAERLVSTPFPSDEKEIVEWLSWLSSERELVFSVTAAVTLDLLKLEGAEGARFLDMFSGLKIYSWGWSNGYLERVEDESSLSQAERIV